ncbi:MAG: VCBS repeat-containing protein [Planctomycetes bacterium]|nr:VCBS repeat-containing protein [Planctomycetota bacterium]
MHPAHLAVALCALTGSATLAQQPGLELEPLPARITTPARFVRLDPATTGLAHVNELRPENVLPYVYNGAGVTVGDFDGDGLCDAYLVSQDGPNRLFRQTAPWRFENVTARLGVAGGEAWGTGASFVDFDGDGDLDLYVSNTESPNLLFRNDRDAQGGVRFVECAAEVGLAHVGASTMPAWADYDNDGDLDLYLVTNRVVGPDVFRPLLARMTLPTAMRKTMAELAPQIPQLHRDADGRWVIPPGLEDHLIALMGRVFYGGQCDRLFRNDGGRFTDVTAAAGIGDHGMGLSATWWDFDDDGWLDLYVACDLESPDVLYHNLGDGRFEPVTERALPNLAYFGMGSHAADIDRDGRFDLVVADMAMRRHYDAKMLMGDMGDRGWFLQFGRPPQIMRNALFLNTGTGRFLEVAQISGVAKTDWTWAVKFADLDLDGFEDLFATNGVPRFDNDPDLGPRFRALWREGRLKEAIELAATVPAVPEPNIALRNEGTVPGTPPHFHDVAPEWGLDHVAISQGAAFADFDRDGDLDVLTNDMNTPAALYENRLGGEHARAVVALRGAGANHLGLGARVTVWIGGVRLDRLLTSPSGYLSTDEPLAFFGLGSATRIDRLEVRWPSGAVQSFRDLPVDQRITVTEPAGTARPGPARPFPPPRPDAQFRDGAAEAGLGDARHVERWFDDFAAQPLVPHQHSQLGPGLAWGDVDGDGRDDLWLGGARGQSGSLWLAGADGFRRVEGCWFDDADREDMGAAFLDVDGDGDLDLFVASGSVEVPAGDASLRDRLYLNDGHGTFAHAPEDALPGYVDSSGPVAAADFDGDGDVDLFVGGRVVPGRYPESPVSRLYRNDAGRLTDVTETIAPMLRRAGLVTGAIWVDLDGDAVPELVVSAHWEPLRAFGLSADGTFEDRTEALGLADVLGWWNGVAAGDVDGDGDLDLVATNVGLNTKYKASREKPARIFAEDFDRSGSLDVVEAKYEGERLLPVRGRSCSSRAIPMLGERFPTYDQFARATLAEIYTPDALATARDWYANELAHVLWRRGDDGRFVAERLPTLAQVAPVFGTAIGDLDGDGRNDLFVAQNFYTPEPETGRMAGGLSLLLRGDGQGGLEPVAPLRTGIVIPEDAKSASIADVDGDARPDLVVATNDGPLRVLLNRASTARWLAVRLAGPAGDPQARGARVTLQLVGADLPAQVQVAGAQLGYLAHAGSELFFGVPAGGPQTGTITVRWRDGRTSAREFRIEPDAGSMRLTVAAPPR